VRETLNTHCLVGDITRTYIASTGVPFIPGDVCVFEGLTHVQNLSRAWYTKHLTLGEEATQQRETLRLSSKSNQALSDIDDALTSYPDRPSALRSTFSYTRAGESQGGGDGSVTPQAIRQAEADLPTSFEIFTSQAIVDRRSTFIGHAVQVTDEREVPLVIHELLSDKKVAKAAHPAIFAYRIKRDVGGAAGVVYNTGKSDKMVPGQV
jgi:hypothetical protein